VQAPDLLVAHSQARFDRQRGIRLGLTGHVLYGMGIVAKTGSDETLSTPFESTEVTT
jgi:hypothetical protein